MTNQNKKNFRPEDEYSTNQTDNETFSVTPSWLRRLCHILFGVFSIGCLGKSLYKMVDSLSLLSDGKAVLDIAVLFGMSYVMRHLYHDYKHCHEAMFALKS